MSEFIKAGTKLFASRYSSPIFDIAVVVEDSNENNEFIKFVWDNEKTVFTNTKHTLFYLLKYKIQC